MRSLPTTSNPQFSFGGEDGDDDGYGGGVGDDDCDDDCADGGDDGGEDGGDSEFQKYIQFPVFDLCCDRCADTPLFMSDHMKLKCVFFFLSRETGFHIDHISFSHFDLTQLKVLPVDFSVAEEKGFKNEDVTIA